jgi:hypothetical protein
MATESISLEGYLWDAQYRYLGGLVPLDTDTGDVPGWCVLGYAPGSDPEHGPAVALHVETSGDVPTADAVFALVDLLRRGETR